MLGTKRWFQNMELTMRLKTILATTLLGAALTVGMTAGASANWAKHHRWAAHHTARVEVNSRLANQNRRIDQNLASGRITQAQARRLHAEDRRIASAEGTDAHLDKSHLTPAERRSLNQNENAVSQQIYNTAH
jgi:hypothetical protein